MRRFVFAQGLLLFALSAQAASNDFTLSSNGLLDNGPMPTVYTCDGLDISPPLQWSHIPPNTQSLALVVSDPDVAGGTFFHWVVYNIPVTTLSFDQGIQQYPKGTIVGKNSTNKNLYSGPCPPKGSSHHYQFTLYALDKKLSLPSDSDGKTVLGAIKDHVLKETVLTAIYSRWL